MIESNCDTRSPLGSFCIIPEARLCFLLSCIYCRLHTLIYKETRQGLFRYQLSVQNLLQGSMKIARYCRLLSLGQPRGLAIWGHLRSILSYLDSQIGRASCRERV